MQSIHVCTVLIGMQPFVCMSVNESVMASQAAGACLKSYMTHCKRCRAVATSDVNKYAWTPPLQDNVEIWLNSLKAAYPWTEILWEHEWINIKHVHFVHSHDPCSNRLWDLYPKHVYVSDNM